MIHHTPETFELVELMRATLAGDEITAKEIQYLWEQYKKMPRINRAQETTKLDTLTMSFNYMKE